MHMELNIYGSKTNLYLSYDDLLALLGIEAPSLELQSMAMTHQETIRVVYERNVIHFVAASTTNSVAGWIYVVLNNVRRTGSYEPHPQDHCVVMLHLQQRVKNMGMSSQFKDAQGVYIVRDKDTCVYTYAWTTNLQDWCRFIAADMNKEYVDAYIINDASIDVYKRAFNSIAFNHIDRKAVAIWHGAILEVDRSTKHTRNDMQRLYEQRMREGYSWGHTFHIANPDLWLEHCDLLHRFYHTNLYDPSQALNQNDVAKLYASIKTIEHMVEDHKASPQAIISLTRARASLTQAIISVEQANKDLQRKKHHDTMQKIVAFLKTLNS